MLKIVPFVALLAASWGASADTTWNFAYQGFYDVGAGQFDAGRLIEGSFVGDDINGDGWLVKDEISSLILNATDYVACSGDSNEFYYCGVDTFSYRIGGTLDFYAGINGQAPDGSVMAGHYFHAGVEEVDYYASPIEYRSTTYAWTTDTQFRISSDTVNEPLPSVPEPGTWGMVIAGLAIIALTKLSPSKKVLATS